VRRACAVLAVSLVLLLAGAANGAAPATLAPTGAPVFPERSFILDLPAPRALTAAQVRVTENGVPVSGLRLDGAAGSQQSQSAVVLAIDASRSMAGKPIAAAVAAAREFVAHRSPKEEIAVVTFNGAVSTVRPFTTDPLSIISALGTTPKIGVGTKLYEALARGLQLIAAADPATASIVVLTDGRDVGSIVKPATVLGRLARAHIRVFSVGIPSPTYDAKTLEDMASTTGGSYVEATSLARLTPTLDGLAARLGSEYLVSYRSRQNPRTGVTVSVAVQGVPGVASSSYVSPALSFVHPAVYAPSTTARIVESPTTVAFVVLAVLVLVIFAITNAVRHRIDPLVERVGGFVSLPGAQPTARQGSGQTAPAASMGLLERAQSSVGRRAWSGRLTASLDLAGIALTSVQVVVLTAGAVVVFALILNLLVGPLGALASFVVIPYGVRYFIRTKIRRKRQAFSEQLPDNLDVLASALRAGHSLVGALSVVAEDASEPSKSEYQRVLADERFGVPFEDALKVTVTRMQNRDLEQVALISRLQREMGSNAAEVLDRVIETVRGKTELRRLVRTLTAQGRLSRWVLSGIPIVLILVISLISPGYMHPLLHTLAGKIILGVAAVLVVSGSIVIGKIVDIKI